MKRKPHYQSDKERVTPLQCWDLFVQGYNAKMQLAEDNSHLHTLALDNHWKQEFDFEQELFRFSHTIIVTDPLIRIVFASSNMYQMNGYLPEEVIGKAPSIFQGIDTCPEQRAKIRQAIVSLQPFEAKLVNYRKNNEPYDCFINGRPVFNRSGQACQFYSF